MKRLIASAIALSVVAAPAIAATAHVKNATTTKHVKKVSLAKAKAKPAEAKK
jgi:hypothetical protein